MNSEVQSLLPFQQIITSRHFVIPDYQRGYSWDEKQVVDLIKDLENVCDKEHMHYTGTIVATRNPDKPEIFEIVDGQQRLTTLITLLMVISDIYKDKYGYLKSGLCVHGDLGSEKFVLRTNLETWECYKTVVYQNKTFEPDIKSHWAIIESKRLLAEYASKKSSVIDELVNAILSKLGFLFFVPTNTKDIGIMFEVINNRGKALSELEKIKNYFIYYSTVHSRDTLRETINSKWGSIQIRLSNAQVTDNDEENSFLRNCYIVFFDTNKSKSWNVYDELKKIFDPHLTDPTAINNNITKISEFIDFLSDASLHYAYLNNSSGFFERTYMDVVGEKKELGIVLKQLRCHPVKASILPLYLAGMSYVKTHSNTVLAFLKLLEVANFRIYILPNAKIARADSRQGELFSWAYEFYHDRAWNSNDDTTEYKTCRGRKIQGDIFAYVMMTLEDFTLELCPEETFIQSLTTDLDEAIDYYYWGGLRFFLASYEESLNKERKETWDIQKILITREEALHNRNDYLSKEHIWASKNREEDFPADCREKRRLGNFVMMGLSSNIQLQKDDIEDKVKFLIDNSSISMRQVGDLKRYLSVALETAKGNRSKRTKYFHSDVATSLIDQRENDLVKFALKRWRLTVDKRSKFSKIDSFQASNDRKKEYYFLAD